MSFPFQNEQKFSYQVLTGEDGQVWTCDPLVNDNKEGFISLSANWPAWKPVLWVLSRQSRGASVH